MVGVNDTQMSACFVGVVCLWGEGYDSSTVL